VHALTVCASNDRACTYAICVQLYQMASGAAAACVLLSACVPHPRCSQAYKLPTTHCPELVVCMCLPCRVCVWCRCRLGRWLMQVACLTMPGLKA
jgi:hypothetical protein